MARATGRPPRKTHRKAQTKALPLLAPSSAADEAPQGFITVSEATGPLNDTSPQKDPRPLYVVVREQIIARIRNGDWQPGQMLPNEFELARTFGVSQGTARKAIDLIAKDGLVVRRQGSGTSVVNLTPQNTPFKFMNIVDERGRTVLLETGPSQAIHGAATVDDAARLKIAVGASVLRIRRVRRRGTVPVLHESIVLPADLFPGLSTLAALPNTLYDLYQKDFGITVLRAQERLQSVAAPADIAAQLSLPAGAPLLKISRIAFGVDDRAIEWRTSHAHLIDLHYATTMGLT